MSMKMIKYILLLLSCLLVINAESIVNTLPGYPGILPFKLQTGYIGVGENDQVQLFYYFIQSENDPTTDPLLLWIPGGPGCSALFSLLYENGPLAFDFENFDGGLPSLIINPYSWTKFANIIFLDTPVGTGFSYSNTPGGYASSDSKAVEDNYNFLRKWFSIHPTFLRNRLYISGDSYGGKMAPLVALQIAKGNEAGLLPIMSIKGYIIGNPVTHWPEDANERVAYAHRMGLISDQQFQLARSSCNGEYVYPDPNNSQCLYALELIKKCTDPINRYHILEPKCSYGSPKPSDSGLLLTPEKLRCRDQNYEVAYIWVNHESVRDSLRIRKETVSDWIRCSDLVFYGMNIYSAVESHQLLAERGIHALVYSGDHDMVVPYTSALKWIPQLNVTLDELWRPWTMDGQVGGYTEKYKHYQAQAYIVFATVKGAGHTAPEYKPKECFAMVQRWLSLDPL